MFRVCEAPLEAFFQSRHPARLRSGNTSADEAHDPQNSLVDSEKL